ncbi:MAG: efflux RND transporter periplasmic adaptor subunit [Candidatus Aminicenantes bacterium]|nr:efflux RND transporter periplasmic adaptor subunit [Candidatus Aminicenantes bacterium]
MKTQHHVSALIGILLTAAAFSCRQAEPTGSSPDPKVPVVLSHVSVEELSRPIHTYGRLAAKEEVRLSFKIPGIIDKISAEEGRSVQKGQVLARLNLSEIESQVSQARSGMEKAKRDLERVRNLYREKAATLEQLQNVETAYEVAKSRLEAAEFNLRYAVIRTPANGKILKRLAEENELVGVGTPIFFLALTDGDWIVRAGISDRDLVRVRKGDPASVTFDAYPEEPFEARLEEIVESADPMTGTYEVELRILPQKKRLVSGFTAEVDIFPSEKKTYSVVPIDSLVEAEGQRAFVFTVNKDNTSVTKHPVRIGFLFKDKAAVLSGLEGIEKVVTEGAPYLAEKSKVEIVASSGLQKEKD